MNGQVESHKNLTVWQKSMDLVSEVYKLVKKLPREENYALSDQIRRASVSIPSNIAEGMGRFTTKDRIRFLDISYGSLYETMCQMEIAYEQHYISSQDFESFEHLASRTSMTIMGLKKNFEIKINNSKNQ